MDMKLRLVLPLVSKLASTSTDLQREGVRELRLLAKFDPENRTAIAKAGAIPLLLKLVSSTADPKIQENSVTTLLNLSISEPNKTLIINEPAVMDVFVHSLTAGHTMETRENSAALVTSLMSVEEHRPLVGQSDGVIEALLDLLLNGSARGKKDALKALFYIATCAENRSLLIRTSGLMDMLTSLLMQRLSGLVEDSLAVLSQALACPESVEVVSGIPTISVIMDLLDTGTSRARENAASALLSFCMCGGARAIEQVMNMKSCVSSLYSLLETGSSRGKGKASALLQILLVS